MKIRKPTEATARLSITVTPKQLIKVRKIAEANNRTMADIVRHAIEALPAKTVS